MGLIISVYFAIFLLLQMISTIKATGVVICGPSGVGKGTIISSICKRFPTSVELSVSHTSRPPRNGETHGVHYFFTTKEEMTRGVAQGMFIEHATVHGNMYGTSKIAIGTILGRNRIPLLDIDVEGVKKIKGIGFDAKYVFLAPPSLAALESRLVGRKSETPEQIRTRLGNAKEEILYGTDANFDFVLVNDDLDLATERLVERLHLWFPLFFPKLHS